MINKLRQIIQANLGAAINPPAPRTEVSLIEPSLLPADECGIKNQTTISTSDDINRWAQYLDINFDGIAKPVNEVSAMTVSAVFACTRLIAGAIASLPLPVYRRTTTGRENAENHPLWWMLNEEPTPIFSAASWWEYVALSVMFRGDSYAYINRNAAGEILEIIPIDSHCVDIQKRNGRNIYLINYDRVPVAVDQDDILHFPGFGFNGLRSLSVLQFAARQSIGTALATEQFASRFFTSGAQPSHIISYPAEARLKDEAIELLRQQFIQRYSGVGNSHQPLVLKDGATVTQLSLSSEDAQLLDSRKYQVVDIARAFGVPPHMIGATDVTSSWGTGIEQQSIGFVTYTLRPYLTRFEQEINRKCFRTAKYFVEFNVHGLLQGDAKAEGDYLRQAIGGSQGPGWMTPNEVRRIKNLPPIDGGYELYDPKGNTNVKTSPPAAA